MGDCQLSAVIPVHDERANITPLWHRLVSVLERAASSCEVIWVDDASEDGSLEELLVPTERGPAN